MNVEQAVVLSEHQVAKILAAHVSKKLGRPIKRPWMLRIEHFRCPDGFAVKWIEKQ